MEEPSAAGKLTISARPGALPAPWQAGCQPGKSPCHRRQAGHRDRRTRLPRVRGGMRGSPTGRVLRVEQRMSSFPVEDKFVGGVTDKSRRDGGKDDGAHRASCHSAANLRAESG
jgi:hypothetical protein